MMSDAQQAVPRDHLAAAGRLGASFGRSCSLIRNSRSTLTAKPAFLARFKSSERPQPRILAASARRTASLCEIYAFWRRRPR